MATRDVEVISKPKGMGSMSQGNAAAIIVRRTSQFANKLRSIQIYIDGEQVGAVKDGQAATFPVPSGQHEVYAKIDWQTSRPLDLTVKPGETITLECGSPLQGWKIALAKWKTATPHEWVYLRRLEPNPK